MAHEKILVVEDELLIAESIKAKLESRDYEVIEIVQSGEKALEAVEKMKPDLVLMDIKLAGDIDGITTAKIIKHKFKIPIIYLTSYSDDEVIKRLKTTNPYGCVLKPFKETDLYTTIEIALNKRALEEKNSERELWLATILNSMTTGLMVTDNNEKIIILNKRGQEILGVEENDVINLPITVISHNLLSMLSIRKGKEKTKGELSFEINSGTKLPVGYTSTKYYDAANEKKGIITIFQDLTEITEMRKRLIDKEKLATVGEIARGIAHEIKNPIFAISSGIQILQMQLELNEDQEETLEIIFEETMRVDRLVKQMMTFSITDTLKYQLVSINKLVSEIIAINQGLLSTKGVTIRKNVTTALEAINADRDKLKQVLLNIVQNAIDVSSADDFITISVYDDRNRQMLCISVKDMGSGIPENLKEEVFNVFFSTKKGNSGLGLTISKKIISEHGGELSIQSNDPCGANFVIALPVDFEE